MNLAVGRRVSVIALAATSVLLSACSPASNSAATPDASRLSPSKSPSPTPVETAAAAVEVVDLPFGSAEEQVTGYWGVGWLAPFAEDDARFTDNTPDDPSSYDFVDNENACTIGMGGARLADKAIPDSDTVISDRMIAAWVFGESASDADVEFISADADVAVLWQEDQAATIDFRVWSGTADDGRTAFVVARGFGDMAAGVLFAIECPAGADSVSEFDEIVEEYARVFVASPTDD